MAWRKINSAALRAGKVLVTNHIDGRDASGQMSHVWVVGGIHKADDPKRTGKYVAFDHDLMIWNITHWCPIPMTVES